MGGPGGGRPSNIPGGGPPPGAQGDRPAGPDGPDGPGGPGGPGGTPSFDDANAIELRDWLLANAPQAQYLVAADSGASGQLSLVETPGVITLGGGFNGSDPTPTAAELADLVDSGQLSYVVVGQQGGRAGAGPADAATGETATVTAERTAWITAHCAPAADAPTTSGTVYLCSPTPP